MIARYGSRVMSLRAATAYVAVGGVGVLAAGLRWLSMTLDPASRRRSAASVNTGTVNRRPVSAGSAAPSTVTEPGLVKTVITRVPRSSMVVRIGSSETDFDPDFDKCFSSLS